MTLHRCLFCLAGASLDVRFDRKGRPFLWCSRCLTRAFVRSLDALRGIAVAPTLLEAAIKRRESESKYREWFDGAIARTVQEVVAQSHAPAAPSAREGLTLSQSIPFAEEKVA